ncbi:MAG TPA: metallopeptidase family protein [Lacipirellulaceae bacterium]|jgi:predicted Zn-dependent protease with MMP-like domain
MDPKLRRLFDEQLDVALAEMPQQVHDLLGKVPMVVEDYPSAEVMRKMRLRHRSSLCGLYTGIPLTRRSINDWGVPSDVIHVFRQGILSSIGGMRNEIDPADLRQQIRITILHELGHHHGMTEGELRELGYG